MKNTISVKVNKTIPGYPVGVSVIVRINAKGIPLEKFWRDRLRDAETDDCIEIQKPKPKTKQDTPKEDTK